MIANIIYLFEVQQQCDDTVINIDESVVCRVN